MAFDKDETKARVEQHVRSGDFFFPEDLARSVAEHLGIDLGNTSYGQVPAAESPTRGSVPPFSGRPATEEHGTDESNKAVKKFDELSAKREKDNPLLFRPRVTAEEVGVDDGLETEVKEEGPIYPDDDSTPETTTKSGATTARTSSTKGKK